MPGRIRVRGGLQQGTINVRGGMMPGRIRVRGGLQQGKISVRKDLFPKERKQRGQIRVRSDLFPQQQPQQPPRGNVRVRTDLFPQQQQQQQQQLGRIKTVGGVKRGQIKVAGGLQQGRIRVRSDLFPQQQQQHVPQGRVRVRSDLYSTHGVTGKIKDTPKHRKEAQELQEALANSFSSSKRGHGSVHKALGIKAASSKRKRPRVPTVRQYVTKWGQIVQLEDEKKKHNKKPRRDEDKK